MKKNGIKHVTSAPYHPQSNGAAENAVKIIKTALKKAHEESVDKQLGLCRYLFDYRNTAHCTTGVSPAELMFGRKLKTRFDIILPGRKYKSNKTVRKIVKTKQGKQKEYFRGYKLRKFYKGEDVMVKDYRVKSKCNWIRGKIKELLGNVMYLVEIPEIGVWRRHANQIKKTWQGNIKKNDNYLNTAEKTTKTFESRTKRRSDFMLRPRTNLRSPDRLKYDV
nr:uncharacterized protein K02A2.6-like [Onthophagus taurus]